MVDEWPIKIVRREIEDAIAADLSNVMRGCHGDWLCTGQTFAALALYEAMSDVSESCWCAAWEGNLGATLWAWLRGEASLREWSIEESLMADERHRILALANVSGVWWADYEFAVPLKDWTDRHGAAPGVENGGKVARYEAALQRLADGALGPTVTAHPFTAIGRVAKRVLEGSDIDQALRELREDHRGQDR